MEFLCCQRCTDSHVFLPVHSAPSHADLPLPWLLLQGPQMRQHEMEELQHIYEERGLPKELAKEVALHLTKNDAVLAHARDELNIDPEELANPGQVRSVISPTVQLAPAAAWW